MKIKRNDFPIFPLNYPQQAKLVKSSRIVARAVDKLSTLFILDPRPEEKKGEVVNWQKEAKKRKKHARFSRWDAGTRWRPRPRERVRFFSRKNGFSMSVNSVAETAQSRLTRAPRPLENTTRRDGR